MIQQNCMHQPKSFVQTKTPHTTNTSKEKNPCDNFKQRKLYCVQMQDDRKKKPTIALGFVCDRKKKLQSKQKTSQRHGKQQKPTLKSCVHTFSSHQIFQKDYVHSWLLFIIAINICIVYALSRKSKLHQNKTKTKDRRRKRVEKRQQEIIHNGRIHHSAILDTAISVQQCLYWSAIHAEYERIHSFNARPITLQPY